MSMIKAGIRTDPFPLAARISSDEPASDPVYNAGS